MAVRNLHNQRKLALQLYIVDDLRKFPAELFCQQDDPDGFIGQGLIQFFLQFLPLMDHSPLDSRQPHAGQGVDVVADKVHLHGITAFLRS